MIELRTSTDMQIELADQRVADAVEKENLAIEAQIKSEANELQAKRAYINLESYNNDLKPKVDECENEVADARQTVIDAFEQVKVAKDILSIEQAKNVVLSRELEQYKSALTEIKQTNAGLLSKLDAEREIKNQALGELKAINSVNKGLQETIAEQNKTIDALKYSNISKPATKPKGGTV